MKTIYFAGGCFWGVEHFFSLLNGVVSTTVGYANSDIENPSYEQVKAHMSSASECVKVEYDDNIITLDELLKLYFSIIDPTSIDKQGHDEGHQYRTGIYYTNKQDLEIINKRMKIVEKECAGKCMVEVMELVNFYDAEEYHQDYLIKNPTGYCHLPLDVFAFAKNYKKNGSKLS